MRDLVSREATKDIQVASVSNSERYIEPTEKTINAMMLSFQRLGQLTPIIVHAVTRNSYRIVAGQTRFKAASRLGWKTIRAEIIAAQAIDYKIIELAENIDRRDLKAAQRRECKRLLRGLLRERFDAVAAGKGGRGHKGGMSEAAREAGVPRSTAQRAAKPAQNTRFGQVSDPAPQEAAMKDKPTAEFPPRQARVKADQFLLASPLSVKVTVEERSRVEKFNTEKCGGGSLSNCMRRLLREGLQRYGYWHEDAEKSAADAA
jgi:hypothetical protein